MNAKFVFPLALAAALPALADVTTANVIGVLRVDSSAAETIVSVPWVATSAAATDTAIPVTDIVKTANLTEGDELRYYNSSSGKYQCWELDHGVWVAAASVAESGNDEAAPSGATLVRGNAIILVRQNPVDDKGVAKPFYLQGQVAKSGSQVCTMTRSATGVAYSLLAPPTDKSVSLNDGTWSGVDVGDYVLVKGKMLKYNNGKWGTYSYENFIEAFAESKDTIDLGQGAWYVSAKGTTSAAKVTWTNLPSGGAN